jgi:hypothetical protein
MTEVLERERTSREHLRENYVTLLPDKRT